MGYEEQKFLNGCVKLVVHALIGATRETFLHRIRLGQRPSTGWGP